ncbi:hypothetical protein CDAR_207611 [Caerostris darwini]|uniref:Uncharacterized protein n=1 Tax=Caerostris darwini TaxID=1538125 RepID=A0AAV4VI32_9ARAC|nr:hypothetical protein CDAR_207611 [Caerostris darwini]
MSTIKAYILRQVPLVSRMVFFDSISETFSPTTTYVKNVRINRELTLKIKWVIGREMGSGVSDRGTVRSRNKIKIKESMLFVLHKQEKKESVLMFLLP